MADPRFASPTVTTAYVPEGVNAKALLRALKERHAVVMAGGQGRLEGQIIRIGHMGWVQQEDLAAVLRALQVELNSARRAHYGRRQRVVDARQPLVLVADPIAEEGLAILRQHARVETVTGDREALERNLKDADALVVRSETRVTAAMLESAPLLRVIGRAGAGVDTIDVAAATARGIVVVECAWRQCSGRRRAHARAVVRPRASDRCRRRVHETRPVGAQRLCRHRALRQNVRLIGLGRVGGEVARRALGLDMHVLVYDPYVPDEHARRIGCSRPNLIRCLKPPTSFRCMCP